MNKTVKPGPRSGRVRIPASKSQGHRLLICAALGEREVMLVCDGISRDIAATAACLNALGAKITVLHDNLLRVRPIEKAPEGLCHLRCGESGSTLRFLLPLVGALGAKAIFYREGRLSKRPLAPLDQELIAHGMRLVEDGEKLYCEGRLLPGFYELPGNVSSQYISGLLMALPKLCGDSTLAVTGSLESAAYITMTEDVLFQAGCRIEKSENKYLISGGQNYSLPQKVVVEGDWSNAAFFLCLGALSPQGITVSGLSLHSSQGDRAILEILRRFGAEILAENDTVVVRRGLLRGQRLDAAPIPDLIPILSVVAAVSEGETRIVNAGRLRLKESDRLQSTAALLRALGGEVTELPDGLVIQGKGKLTGGIADSAGDHRIAMSAAAAASVCTGPLTVLGAECVEKSYPRFWDDFGQLEGEER